MNVTVDAEFQALIPPLTTEERSQLEANVTAEGCRDPLATWRGLLLDGHNRRDICDRAGIRYETIEIDLPDRDAAKVWIIRNQFGRRNLTPYQRAELALKLEPLVAAKAKANQRQSEGTGAKGRQKSDNLSPVDTKRELARAAGVSHDTIHKAKVIAEKAPEPVKEKLRSGETSINAAYRDIKKAEQKAEKAKAKSAVPSDLPAAGDRYRLIHADLAAVNGEVPDGSADWIITDPPYPREFLPVYATLSAFAARALKPGGSLLVMVGQSYLPEILASLSSHMRYQWALAYLTPGGQAVQLWDRKVNTFWKPVLWFVKGDYAGDWIGDVARSDVNDNDKRFHGWGQSESGMADLIDRFTYPGQTIVDPFVGGGTTGVVALKMNRRFVGIDVDAGAIETAKRRLSEAAR